MSAVNATGISILRSPPPKTLRRNGTALSVIAESQENQSIDEPGQPIPPGTYTPHEQTVIAFQTAFANFNADADVRIYLRKATMDDVKMLADWTSAHEWQNHVFFEAMERYAQALEIFMPNEKFLSVIWGSMRAVVRVRQTSRGSVPLFCHNMFNSLAESCELRLPARLSVHVQVSLKYIGNWGTPFRSGMRATQNYSRAERCNTRSTSCTPNFWNSRE
jgi:hypothetical protein